MRMLALITDSLREIYARKVIIGIVIIEVVALTITGLILFSDGMQRSYADARMAGIQGAQPGLPTPPVDSFDEHAADDSLLREFDTTGATADTVAAADTARSRALTDVAPPAPGSGGGVIEGAGELVIEETVKGELGGFAVPTLLATLFLGIFATAGIVPSMMEKGTIDLLLSKPLPRWQLLWGRAAGGAIAVAVNLLFFTTAVWALYGLASGVWYVPFIGLAWLFAFGTFLVLYTGIIALNVTTDSWVLPMSIAYIQIVIISNFLTNREVTIFQWVESPFIQTLITGLYYALPQTNDLITQTPSAVMTGGVTDWAPLVHGGIFALVMIAFTTWRFQRKDF